MVRASMGVVAIAAGLAQAGANPFLLVPNSSTNTVFLFDSFDGSLVNDAFIDQTAGLAALGYTGSSLANEAIEVGNEIWVSDQNADRIVRYNKFTRQAVGQIGVDGTGAGQLELVRGITLIGNTVYAALGGDSASFGEGILTIDAGTGMITGNFNGRDPGDTSYWDIVELGGELLVTNSDTGNDGIERYDFAGTYLGNLVSSDGVSGIDFPQQMNFRSNGNLIVGGFTPPDGVYEYAPDGTFVGTPAGVNFGPRAAYELGNGGIAWTNGTWFRTDADIFSAAGSFRYINGVSVPAPASAALLGVMGLVAGRRRR